MLEDCTRYVDPPFFHLIVFFTCRTAQKQVAPVLKKASETEQDADVQFYINDALSSTSTLYSLSAFPLQIFKRLFCALAIFIPPRTSVEESAFLLGPIINISIEACVLYASPVFICGICMARVLRSF